MAKVTVTKSPKRAQELLDKLDKRILTASRVKVGLPKGSNAYPDGTSVIMVGATHEFGSDEQNIPQRSFLRTTMIENRKKYKGKIRKLVKKIVNDEIDSDKALGLMGLMAQTDVRDKIDNIKTPPLKHRDGNPLWDTGHLIQSIIFEVDK